MVWVPWRLLEVLILVIIVSLDDGEEPPITQMKVSLVFRCGMSSPLNEQRPQRKLQVMRCQIRLSEQRVGMAQ